MVGREGEASSRRVEATNSLIKIQGDRAPAIYVELLSSRIQLKSELVAPILTNEGVFKWSSICPVVIRGP
eukprot:6782415-Pyramimonas_sp.AAC.1